MFAGGAAMMLYSDDPIAYMFLLSLPKSKFVLPIGNMSDLVMDMEQILEEMVERGHIYESIDRQIRDIPFGIR